ncbi:MAG TPA: glycosyltransferase, partial [Phototrophicaceae bacterium]|nr:glycosyltransferase [Phototrophicaceae bacterium]
WRHQGQAIHIYGFVTNMPRLMAGADMLVTKAGPATICEACIAGLPVILSDAIPGQEDGNIDYVVENHIGVYAPNPSKVANAVSEWLAEGIDAIRARGERARAISRPQAVWDIADEVWEYAQRPMVKNARRPFLRKSSKTS